MFCDQPFYFFNAKAQRTQRQNRHEGKCKAGVPPPADFCIL